MNTLIPVVDHRAKVNEAQEHLASLQRSKPLMEEKADKYRQNITKDSADDKKASLALEQLERDYLRDLVDASEVEAGRKDLMNVRSTLAANERMCNLALAEINNIDQGIIEAQNRIKDCVFRLCVYEREKMINVLNSNSELRENIMEVYSAQMVKSNWSTPGWGGFLSAIFSAPTEAETKQAIASYKQRNGIAR